MEFYICEGNRLSKCTYCRSCNDFQVLHSEGILVGNRKALISNAELLQIAKELIERFDAHLKAEGYYSVIANLRGPSSEAVAERLLATDTLAGLDGPTISPVYSKSLENGGQTDATGLYATVICVAKNELYETIKQLRKVVQAHLVITLFSIS